MDSKEFKEMNADGSSLEESLKELKRINKDKIILHFYHYNNPVGKRAFEILADELNDPYYLKWKNRKIKMERVGKYKKEKWMMRKNEFCSILRKIERVPREVRKTISAYAKQFRYKINMGSPLIIFEENLNRIDTLKNRKGCECGKSS